MCQICTDLADYDALMDSFIKTELTASMKADRDAFMLGLHGQMSTAQCRHAYVTSDGQCLHCKADCTNQIAAAVDALNANIARSWPKVTYYDAAMNRHDCTSCGTNAQTLTHGRCAMCIELSRPHYTPADLYPIPDRSQQFPRMITRFMQATE